MTSLTFEFRDDKISFTPVSGFDLLQVSIDGCCAYKMSLHEQVALLKFLEARLNGIKKADPNAIGLETL